MYLLSVDRRKYEKQAAVSYLLSFAISSPHNVPFRTTSLFVSRFAPLVCNIKHYDSSLGIKLRKNIYIYERLNIHFRDLAFPCKIGNTSLHGVSLTSP